MGQAAEQHSAADVMHPAETQDAAAQQVLRSGDEVLPALPGAEAPERPNPCNPFRDYVPHPAAKWLVRHFRATGLVLYAVGAAAARWYARLSPDQQASTRGPGADPGTRDSRR